MAGVRTGPTQSGSSGEKPAQSSVSPAITEDAVKEERRESESPDNDEIEEAETETMESNMENSLEWEPTT